MLHMPRTRATRYPAGHTIAGCLPIDRLETDSSQERVIWSVALNAPLELGRSEYASITFESEGRGM
jgi:hypothetical protein